MRLSLLAALLALAGAIAACGGGGDDGGGQAEVNPFGLQAQTVASAPDAVALNFAPDGRLFFAEKYTGNIRIVNASGKLLDEPFAHVDALNWLNTEWGLTGLALDPGFATNHYVYAFYTELTTSGPDGGTPDSGRPIARPVLVRFTEKNNLGTDRTVLIDDFPETRLDHQGFKANGSLRFGPDGALYMTMGDYDWNKGGPSGTGAAQDLGFPGGKVLRVDTSGRPLPNNPFTSQPSADPRIFAYGFSHGNALVFNPETKNLYTTDSTDSCEELDVVTAGGNYGWPDVGDFPFADCYAGSQVRALYLLARAGTSPGGFQSGPVVTGLSFLTGTKYPAIGNGLLVCSAFDKLLRRLTITGGQVTAADPVISGCEHDVTVGPDGTIFISSKTEIKRLLPGTGTPAPASKS